MLLHSPLNSGTRFLGKVGSFICLGHPCFGLENDTGYCGVE